MILNALLLYCSEGFQRQEYPFCSASITSGADPSGISGCREPGLKFSSNITSRFQPSVSLGMHIIFAVQPDRPFRSAQYMLDSCHKKPGLPGGYLLCCKQTVRSGHHILYTDRHTSERSIPIVQHTGPGGQVGESAQFCNLIEGFYFIVDMSRPEIKHTDRVVVTGKFVSLHRYHTQFHGVAIFPRLVVDFFVGLSSFFPRGVTSLILS
jgi:hypothetical protein